MAVEEFGRSVGEAVGLSLVAGTKMSEIEGPPNAMDVDLTLCVGEVSSDDFELTLLDFLLWTRLRRTSCDSTMVIGRRRRADVKRGGGRI